MNDKINVSVEAVMASYNKIDAILADIEKESDIITDGANEVVDVWQDDNGLSFSDKLDTEIKPKLSELKSSIGDILSALKTLAHDYEEQSSKDKAAIESIEI